MAEVRFGGPLGKLLVAGKPTPVRGFGSLEVSAEDDSLGAHATQALTALLERRDFDIAGAAKDSSALKGELEAQLSRDFAGRLTVQVKMLMISIPE
jgi:hypothetical protein